MTESTPTYAGDQPAEPTAPLWERRLRGWPRDRIRPAVVASGLDRLFAELDAARKALAAAQRVVKAYDDCPDRANIGDVFLAVSDLKRTLAAVSTEADHA